MSDIDYFSSLQALLTGMCFGHFFVNKNITFAFISGVLFATIIWRAFG